MTKVMKGQKATYSQDRKTITTVAYPKKPGYAYKLQEKTWKNYCPLCKKEGTLVFNPKKAPEAELTCGDGKAPWSDGCDADFCCVSGLDTHSGKPWGKLTPATAKPNKTTKVAGSKTQKQKCELSKAKARTKAKSLLDTKSSYKGTLKVPVMKGINLGDLVNINLNEFPEIKNKNLYIDSIKEDIDSQTYTIELLEGKNHLNTKYEGDYIFMNKKGAIIGASSKNPRNAKCKNVNINIGLKDRSPISKKIKLKGQELGTVAKIYKWLKVKTAGGTGGWKYKKYGNHRVTSEKEDKFGAKSAEKCWNSKTANCTDFAWIMAKMGEGAGKQIGVRKGTYTSSTGAKKGHMWNYYKSKYYDCSSSAKTTIDFKKVEKVK